MAALTHAVRWFAALPLALVAGAAAQRMVGFLMALDVQRSQGFHHLSIWSDAGFFLMAGAFLTVGVWIVPSRKDSVARIALGVVVVDSAILMALGAASLAITPIFWGASCLLGGVVAFLPWRLQKPSQAAEA